MPISTEREDRYIAGTKDGGRKSAETLRLRDPGFHARIGAKGGKNGTGYKFGHGKVDPHVVGAIGGKISRPPKHRELA